MFTIPFAIALKAPRNKTNMHANEQPWLPVQSFLVCGQNAKLCFHCSFFYIRAVTLLKFHNPVGKNHIPQLFAEKVDFNCLSPERFIFKTDYSLIKQQL